MVVSEIIFLSTNLTEWNPTYNIVLVAVTVSVSMTLPPWGEVTTHWTGITPRTIREHKMPQMKPSGNKALQRRKSQPSETI